MEKIGRHEDDVAGVYALLAPGTREVRYVGHSGRIRQRVYTHASDGIRLKLAIRSGQNLSNYPRIEWLRSLMDHVGDIRPEVRVLAREEDREERKRLERIWIVRLAANGHRLFNASPNMPILELMEMLEEWRDRPIDLDGYQLLQCYLEYAPVTPE